MPGGRPTALTEASGDAVLNAVRIGVPLSRAAAFGGVAYESLKAWRRRATAAQAKPAGRRSQTERRYVEFSAKLDRALEEAAVRAQSVVFAIMDAGSARAGVLPDAAQQRVSLQAATWYLANRANGDYSTRAELTGAGGGPVELDAASVLEKLRAIAGEAPEEEEG